MKDVDRRGVNGTEVFEGIWAKLDEIVQWINEYSPIKCGECGYRVPKMELEANYGNCPNCGHKIN